MQHLKIFFQLTRLDKPIGFMLLFWPCSWGLAYAYSINQNFNLFIYYLILFFLGSVLMRSAGCIFNDIVDKDFDKKVKRTKKRLIASNKVNKKEIITYSVINLSIGSIPLYFMPIYSIFISFCVIPLILIYPFMKRYTNLPQVVLGIAFSWGILMAFTAQTETVPAAAILLFIANTLSNLPGA